MHVHVHSGKTMTTDPKIQMVARGQDTCSHIHVHVGTIYFNHRKSGGSAHSS